MIKTQLGSFAALSRTEMRNVKGGNTELEVIGDVGDSGGRCIKCETDHDCLRINKGSCVDHCGGGTHKGCDGW